MASENLSEVKIGEELALPEPKFENTLDLFSAFKNRKTTKSFKDEAISLQKIANIFWVAGGYNRRSPNMRTAPSTLNWQEIEVYGILKEGIFKYQPEAHSLLKIKSEDLRSVAGFQEYVHEAPLSLIYVANFEKMEAAHGKFRDINEQDRIFFSATDTAFNAENVYIYCAGDSLGCVVRAGVDRDALAEELKLGDSKQVVLGQTIGVPK